MILIIGADDAMVQSQIPQDRDAMLSIFPVFCQLSVLSFGHIANEPVIVD